MDEEFSQAAHNVRQSRCVFELENFERLRREQILMSKWGLNDATDDKNEWKGGALCVARDKGMSV